MRLLKYLSTVLLAGGLTIAAGHVAWAATDVAPFTRQAFLASQKQGKPILVQITASWCPTCAAQRPILSRLEAEPKFKSLVVYNIDFDSQKAQVHAMGVRMQSTLIVFKGSAEKGRSTGMTDPAAIESLLAKSVN